MSNITFDSKGRRVLKLDAGAKNASDRDLSFALQEAQQYGDNIIVELQPGVYPLSYDDPMRGKCLAIRRSMEIRAAIPGTVNVFGMADDSDNMVFVRNSDHGVKLSVVGIDFNCGRIADTRQDRTHNCFEIHAGKPGTRTEVSIDKCRFRQGNGAAKVLANIFGEQGNDDLLVHMSDCVIEDMFEDRDANGVKVKDHSGGIFHDGGTLIMDRIMMRRLGWVPGSNFYVKSNKNQALYAVRGVRKVTGCIVEDCAHGGFAYRAGTTFSTGNIVRRTPLAFQAGHFQTPWLAEVTSYGDQVQDGGHITQVNSEGSEEHILTAGFSLEAAAFVSLSHFKAWNVTGRGDWGGFHVRSVSPREGKNDPPGETKLELDVDTIDVAGWRNPVVVHSSAEKHEGLRRIIKKYQTQS